MNRLGRKVAYAGVAACIAVVAILFINTLRLSSRQLIVAPLAPPMVDAHGAAERLAGSVRLRTISYETPSATSRSEFLVLHSYLEAAFAGRHRESPHRSRTERR